MVVHAQKVHESYPVSNVQLCKYTLKCIQKTQLGYILKLSQILLSFAQCRGTMGLT